MRLDRRPVRSGMGPISAFRRNGNPAFLHYSVVYGQSVYAMSFLLLRTNPIHSRCVGLSLCRALNAQTITLYQPIRHFTYKKKSELTRKEREIIRYDSMDSFICRRQHVKEGNTITYIGAGVNVLLSGLKVTVLEWWKRRPSLVTCCIRLLSSLVDSNPHRYT